MKRHNTRYAIDDEEERGDLNLASLIAAMRRRLSLLACTTALISVLVAIVVWSLPNRYDAAAVVQIDSRRKTISNIEGVLSDLKADSASIDSEVEIIRSKAIILPVIDRLDLRKDDEFTARSPFARLAALIGREPAFSNRGAGSMPPPEAGSDPIARHFSQQGKTRWPERDGIASAFGDKLKVSRVRNTLLIEIKYSSTDPVKAAVIANTIAEVYVNEQLGQKSRAAEAATALLREKVDELRSKLGEAESKVEKYKGEHSIFDSSGRVLSEQELSRLAEQTSAARNIKSEARAKYEQVRKLLQRGGDATSSIGDILNNLTIRSFKEQLAAAQRREAELITKYGPNHPEMRKVHADVQEARANLDAEMGRLLASVRNDYEVAEARERQLLASLEAHKQQEIQAKSASLELKELEREATSTKHLYEALLARYKQTAETQGLQLPDARIVERADPPLFPAFPKRTLLALAGVVFGLGLGAGLAILLEFASPGLVGPEDVERILEVAHLSSLPAASNAAARPKDPVLPLRLVVAEPSGAFAEAIRRLGREVEIRRRVGQPRVILVASSLPGEGSESVASNLAHHYALTGKRILLIDGDPRRATLSKQLAAQRTIGLVEVLAAGLPLEQGILHDATTGLHFLPAIGQAPVQRLSPDMLQSVQFTASLDKLRRQFDTIIINAPPILPVVDSRVLAAQADQILFVLAARRTARQHAKRALRFLGVNQRKLLGVVACEADPSIIAEAGGFASPFAAEPTLGRAA